MTQADRIVAELMDALDMIRVESDKPDANRHYIRGIVLQAMTNCDANRERNADGYLVIARAKR